MSHVSRYEITIEWGDCDPARIVFYPNYFAWFDRGSHHLLDALGLGHDTLIERYGVVGVPIAEASARFLVPSEYRQKIALESRIESWAGRRFTILHQGFRDGTLLLEGREVRFFGVPHPEQKGRLKAVPIPPDIIARFEEDVR